MERQLFFLIVALSLVYLIFEDIAGEKRFVSSFVRRVT